MCCRSIGLFLLLGAVVLATGHRARANLITNGGFETPIVTNPALQFLNIVAGSEPAAFGWHVTSGEVDNVIGGSLFPPAFNGLQYLDLDGFVPGSISQSFATTPSTTYVLRFVYANNPHGGGTNCVPPILAPCATIPAHATVTIFDAGTATQLITPLVLTHLSSTVANANWVPSGDIAFVAQGTTTTLSFVSNNPGTSNGGVFLDAVAIDAASVQAVPEPSSYALVLAGLSLAGIRCFRRAIHPPARTK